MPAYTWAAGETITATKLNTLETEAWRVANLIAEGASSSQTSTTSTSFVDAAATVTFTAKSTSVYIQVCGGGMSVNGSTITVFCAININGTDYTVTHADIAGSYQYPYAGGVLVTGLTAGNSYTAKTRLRVSAATSTGYLVRSSSSRQTITVWDISK